MQIKYEKLRVWSQAMDLSEQIYSATREFPRDEVYGLTAQLRRASVSIAANIAEGAGRYHTREFIHFLYVSRGSLFEVMTLLTLVRRLGYIQPADFFQFRGKFEGLLAGLSSLLNSLDRRSKH
jgi:four helix bundle protein